jgi:hypothetical protein
MAYDVIFRKRVKLGPFRKVNEAFGAVSQRYYSRKKQLKDTASQILRACRAEAGAETMPPLTGRAAEAEYSAATAATDTPPLFIKLKRTHHSAERVHLSAHPNNQDKHINQAHWRNNEREPLILSGYTAEHPL